MKRSALRNVLLLLICFLLAAALLAGCAESSLPDATPSSPSAEDASPSTTEESKEQEEMASEEDKTQEETIDPVRAYYETKCAAFSVMNANLSKGQIVFVGDSITDLCPLDDYYADLPLASYNRGIGGDTTVGLLARMGVSLYDLAPSKIVLMIGVNDVNCGADNETTLANYAAILRGIKENLPDAEVYCMSVISENDVLERMVGLNVESNMLKILSLNPSLKSLAESFGYTYVDLYSAVSDENDRLKYEYSDDGIHLNAAGFAVWASVIKPYLR